MSRGVQWTTHFTMVRTGRAGVNYPLGPHLQTGETVVHNRHTLPSSLFYWLVQNASFKSNSSEQREPCRCWRCNSRDHFVSNLRVKSDNLEGWRYCLATRLSSKIFTCSTCLCSSEGVFILYVWLNVSLPCTRPDLRKANPLCSFLLKLYTFLLSQVLSTFLSGLHPCARVGTQQPLS